MAIGRGLRVRGKLNLLLVPPLAAVVLVAVPFLAGQVQNARSAGATADAARTARQLGALVWELQRERLVTADYLADPSTDDSATVLQQQAVDDSADSLRRSLGPNASDELTSALVRLGSLAELRQNARHRGVALDSVARAYHAVIEALIDSLRLVSSQQNSDAEGTRQLTALDALLRANEESALRGMALIVAAVRPQVGRPLLGDSSAQSQLFTERFVQQANADQAGLVVLVDQGDAAHQLDALAGALPDPGNQTAVLPFVRGTRAAAEAQANLRRLVQDQVTSQIADAAAERAGGARITAWIVGLGALLLFGLVVGLAFVVSRSIAQPLQRLTRAATAVADLANTELVRVVDEERSDEQPPRLAAISVSSSDEVGDLAVAFNRVQTTAAQLLERQAVTRRNVSLMFANVAQRTQNLVGRQLALVDDLERDEQSSRLLTSLYRLDHLSTRLRRNAENLLVIAGSNDRARTMASTPLVTVLRSALAEIEDYQRVNFGAMKDVTIVAPLVSDLVLVFAELLENATAFSPPSSTVDVSAGLVAEGWCRISIVDHGIGMSEAKLAEENRRMVERERLDIVPTSVLGLFVVGRLARRHDLSVTLEPTPNGGVTAQVAVPPSLLAQDRLAVPAMRPALVSSGGLGRRLESSVALVAVPLIPQIPGQFEWFSHGTGERPAIRAGNDAGTPRPIAATAAAPALQAGPAEEPPPVEQAELVEDNAPEDNAPVSPPVGLTETHRSGLKRRVRGAQLPVAAHPEPDHVPTGPRHDPVAARDAMDAFQTAVARAGRTSGPGPSTGNGAPPALTRRTPGASLAPGLREAPSGTPRRRPVAAAQRDPEAERAAFDSFVSGLAKAQTKPGAWPPRADETAGTTKEGTQQ